MTFSDVVEKHWTPIESDRNAKKYILIRRGCEWHVKTLNLISTIQSWKVKVNLQVLALMLCRWRKASRTWATRVTSGLQFRYVIVSCPAGPCQPGSQFESQHCWFSPPAYHRLWHTFRPVVWSPFHSFHLILLFIFLLQVFLFSQYARLCVVASSCHYTRSSLTAITSA